MNPLITKQKNYLSLSLKDFGNFRCPTCNNGYIDPTDAIIHASETPETHKFIQQNGFVPQEYEGQFSVVLNCSNCTQKFHISGVGYYEHERIGWEKEKSWPVYLPKYLNPSPHLFELPKGIDEAVQEEIVQVFNFFWFDYSACGNRIRIAIERLLDFLDVPSPKGMILHDRIKHKIPDKYTEIKKYLLAIKWLGNKGSHESNLSKSDIVDALSLFEYVINSIFVDARKELDYLAEQINKQKGPRNK